MLVAVPDFRKRIAGPPYNLKLSPVEASALEKLFNLRSDGLVDMKDFDRYFENLGQAAKAKARKVDAMSQFIKASAGSQQQQQQQQRSAASAAASFPAVEEEAEEGDYAMEYDEEASNEYGITGMRDAIAVDVMGLGGKDIHGFFNEGREIPESPTDYYADEFDDGDEEQQQSFCEEIDDVSPSSGVGRVSPLPDRSAAVPPARARQHTVNHSSASAAAVVQRLNVKSPDVQGEEDEDVVVASPHQPENRRAILGRSRQHTVGHSLAAKALEEHEKDEQQQQHQQQQPQHRVPERTRQHTVGHSQVSAVLQTLEAYGPERQRMHSVEHSGVASALASFVPERARVHSVEHSGVASALETYVPERARKHTVGHSHAEAATTRAATRAMEQVTTPKKKEDAEEDKYDEDFDDDS